MIRARVSRWRLVPRALLSYWVCACLEGATLATRRITIKVRQAGPWEVCIRAQTIPSLVPLDMIERFSKDEGIWRSALEKLCKCISRCPTKKYAFNSRQGKYSKRKA